MEIHHKVTVHLQKLCQHLVRKLWCKNLKIRNGSYRSTHLKVFSILKYEAGRCDIILCAKTCTKYLIIRKMKRDFTILIECLVHDLQPFRSIQRIRCHSKNLEVIHNIRLDTFQLRSCFPDIFCFNTKGDILGTHQTIITFRQLIIKHLCKLHTQIIKLILLRIDMDNLFILRHVAVLIDKRKLKMNRAVKII